MSRPALSSSPSRRAPSRTLDLAHAPLFEEVRNVGRRRRWLAVVCFVALMAPIATIVSSLPDLYRSTVTVLIERRHVPEAFLRSSITSELDTRLQSISQKMLSRSRLGAVITRFDLYPELRRAGSLEDAIERMRRDIQFDFKAIEQGIGRGATLAFTIGYQGAEPTTVAVVTNALASFHLEENLRVQERMGTSAVAFLKTQLDEAAKRLAEADGRVADFKKRHGVEMPQQVAINLSILERLNTQLRLTSESLARAMERRGMIARPFPGGEVLGAPMAPDGPEARLARLKRELRELSRQYTAKYPEVMRVKSEIAAAEADLASADRQRRTDEPSAPVDPAMFRLRESVAALDAEIKSLSAEEQSLRKEIDSYRARLENAPQREQDFQEVSRAYETTKEHYFTVLKRYEEATLAESLEQRQRGEEFRVLDPAIPPGGPSAPKRLRLVLFGAFIALGATVGVVLLVEHTQSVFHTVDDLRAATHLPVVASIPLIVSVTDTRHRRRRIVMATVSGLLCLGCMIAAAHHFASGNYGLVALVSAGRQ